MRIRFAFLLFALVAPLLGACTKPVVVEFPELTFRHKTPVRLAVGSVQVINEFQMPFAAPNVEHKMPVAPGPAAERWAQDVLQALGGTDRLVMVVTDASVREIPLQVKQGIKGIFTTDQAERYESRMAVRLEIRTPDNKRQAVAEAFATRSATIAENTSLADREALWYGLTEDLMDDLDSAIRSKITAHFGAFLR